MNNVVREVLRMDDPANEGFENVAVQDIEICGVQIPKGTVMRTNLTSAHYDEDYWMDGFVKGRKETLRCYLYAQGEEGLSTTTMVRNVRYMGIVKHSDMWTTK